MAKHCEIWSTICNIDWLLPEHTNNNTVLKICQNELLLSINSQMVTC